MDKWHAVKRFAALPADGAHVCSLGTGYGGFRCTGRTPPTLSRGGPRLAFSSELHALQLPALPASAHRWGWLPSLLCHAPVMPHMLRGVHANLHMPHARCKAWAVGTAAVVQVYTKQVVGNCMGDVDDW